ncbi:far-red-elongated hypocotyl1-like [Raphanus sativus]|uniref:Protein FAR-RED-ELONGATED HYPOCOTYL 1-LIKE isoform X1 n=2 Tax=Raphanus sativus TaxID=3726 RepID=A0A6J0KG57_RAPSA|nr:protein FAR-RED-ELONGATED HYPOCOTYL 1-LIKE isoform X1 [Raphanus sativus]KAJ4882268.1 far-red-elongated hypocotyl1-like [Raphanus sativus]
MDTDETSRPSLDHSEMMMVAEEESFESSRRKRKLPAEESDLLPLAKHFCLEQQQQASLPDWSCSSSDIESAECSNAMEDTKNGDETSSSAYVCMSAKDSCYSTGSSSLSSGYAASGIEECCSKGNDKTPEEYVEFICSEFAVEELLGCEDSNLQGSSYTLSSARWSVSNQDMQEATAKKPTIDKEFEEYFSTLMM